MARVARSSAVVFLVAIVACMAGTAISWPFWRHLWILGGHLASGNWEIASDNAAVERAIQLKYGADPRGIAVHRIAGSGLLLPITDPYRSATIDRVARVSLAEQPALRFRSTPLETSYNELLRAMEGQIARAPTAFPPETTKLIGQARLAYDKAKTDLGVDFPPFAVTTEPVFDRDGAWRRNAVTLEQNGRCAGQVVRLGGGEEPVPGDIRTFPTALEVKISRPWLNQPLLDLAARHPSPELRSFYGIGRVSDGGLRLIPQSLWILQADAVQAKVDEAAKEKIVAWVRDNACCRIECADRALSLDPATVRWKDNTLHGTLTAPAQQLFAIVSTRRGG